MKRYITTLVMVFSVALCTYAQVDRSTPPPPGPEREVKIADYQSFTLPNGLRVFVVENHKLPRLRLAVRLLHDPVMEREKAGYMSIAGQLMGNGTKTRSKAQLDEEIDYMGAELNVSSRSVSASSLTKHQDKLLELMTDVLYNPAWDKKELEKLKKQSLSSLAASKDDPNFIAHNLMKTLFYGKEHPYGELRTEETIGNITVEDCKKYYETYFRPNNAYLIMVGDITLEEAKRVAEDNFSKWTPKELPTVSYPRPTPPEKSFVGLVDRPASVQSVIRVGHPVDIRFGSPDALKSAVMNTILGDNSSARLYLNLREQHGYTYGAYSQFSVDNIVGRFSASASTRNAVTDSAIYEMMVELNRIRDELVSDEELRKAKAIMKGEFIRSLEYPATIARFAFNTAKYNLPADYYSTFLKRLEAVTVEDVQQAAKKHIHPDRAYVLAVGKGADVADNLKKFGRVAYYDNYGNPYEKKELKLSADMTAEQVVKNYIEAIGGKKRLEAVKSIELRYKVDVGPMKLDASVLKKEPKRALVEMKQGDNTVMRTVANGEKVQMFQMGRRVPVDKVTREKVFYSTIIFPELRVGEDIKVALLSVEKVKGKEAYVVEYTLPSGMKPLVYYDKVSALKIKEVAMPEGESPGLVTEWRDYREQDGVKIPRVMRQNSGGNVLSFSVTKVTLNPEVPDTTFNLD